MRLRSFIQDRRGAVAPIFALSIIPVIGLVGMAVDYSRANSIKAALQASLDATALAMARLAPTLTRSSCSRKAATTSRRSSPAGGEERRHHDRLHDDRRIDAEDYGKRQRRHHVHAHHGLIPRSVSAPRRPSSGATSACASRSCSTPPARWRAPARSTR
jgi:hypothetical protein